MRTRPPFLQKFATCTYLKIFAFDLLNLCYIALMTNITLLAKIGVLPLQDRKLRDGSH